MDTCAVCRAAIEREYFRVATVVVCPACVELERTKENASKTKHFRRGLLFASGAAIVSSLILWLVDEFSTVSGGSLFSAGSMLRGTATLFSGAFIGMVAMTGAKKRGSRRLQVSAVILTYLAFSMAFVPFLLTKVPSEKLTPSLVVYLIALGPVLPVLGLIKNPLVSRGWPIAIRQLPLGMEGYRKGRSHVRPPPREIVIANLAK